MPGYTVMEVDLPREWEGQYGKMLSYDMTVSGPDGQVKCELAQKPETPAPKEGDLIQGTIQPGKNGYPGKLKKEKPQQGGLSPGKPKQRDPGTPLNGRWPTRVRWNSPWPWPGQVCQTQTP